MDAASAAPILLSGQALKVAAGGETFDILPDEVEVRADAKSGFAVAAEGAYLAALVTELTPDLVREGLAREFVRRVQDLRKTSGLDVADRIKLHVAATPGLKEAVEANREYVTVETLTVELRFSDPSSLPGAGSGSASVTDEFDKEKVTIELIKA
jgi:isoleucyl-tRNA synthetase